MKNYKKIIAAFTALSAMILCTAQAGAASENTVNITINTASERKSISPYIYGISSELMDRDVSAAAIRAGGNRYSAYNWETNASNAGLDWKHMSDRYFQRDLPDDLKSTPGAVAINLSRKCAEKNNAYSLMTLQMAGYVSADFLGTVKEEDTAPSERWNKVDFKKGTSFADSPDKEDGVVYMDEFVNYLVNTLGDSQSENGIKGYSLDNEPGLWKGTHSRVHPEQTGCAEIVEKSKELAKAVKDVDPHADIFGPALFGYGAFTNFAGAPDWDDLKQNGDYRWFIDYYLDEMKKAEDESGVRLLDVLDVHFYTEAKGKCGERYCEHYDNRDCVKEILNSPRSLWDESYKEDSWIVDTGAEFLPLLPNLQQSIDKFYPDTKIAITEYNFGGNNSVCGSIAEADALGLFAKHGVYAANLFVGDADYQCAAIDLYRNYDGNSGSFGDTLVYCETDDVELSTAYAAVNSESDEVLTLVVTNKSFDEKTTANIKIEDGSEYKYVHIYGIKDGIPAVQNITESSNFEISDGNISYEMDPKSVSLLVVSKNKNFLQSQSEKSSSALWLIIGAAAVVAFLIGGAAVLKIKKEKS